MENTNYTFQITAYDIEKLLPQVSKALEKRTELVSREQYPGLWKHTDKLNTMVSESARGGLSTKIKSILLLALGVFLFVPGLVKPQELLVPLIGGAVAICMGISGLWRSRKHKSNPFDKSAKLLLEGKDNISAEQSVVVSFAETGMTIPAENASSEFVPYSNFECVIETADIFLFVYGERVTVLQKTHLTTGNVDYFSNFISEKISKYYLLINHKFGVKNEKNNS